MCKYRLAGLVLLSVCALVPLARAADTWYVENNFDRDFTFVITSAGGNPSEYELKARETVPISLGEDPHTLVTSLATGEQRQTHRQKRLKPVAANGVTLLETIRSPIGTKLPSGVDIYQAMPDFPYSDTYTNPIDELRRSRWSGRYDGRAGWINLQGETGNASQNTRLEGIQYVPGDTYLVVGKWIHGRERGEFILMVDPLRPRQQQLRQGYYRNEGRRQWSRGIGERR